VAAVVRSMAALSVQVAFDLQLRLQAVVDHLKPL
jgi:hypothetical protein